MIEKEIYLYLQVYISTCSVVNALKIHFKARSKIVRGKTCTQRTGQRLVWQMICSILSLFISSVVTGNLSPSSNKSVFRLRHLTRKIYNKETFDVIFCSFFPKSYFFFYNVISNLVSKKKFILNIFFYCIKTEKNIYFLKYKILFLISNLKISLIFSNIKK